MSGKLIQIQKSNFAYTEVVEGGVGQPTSGDVFGQLIQHLGILHDLIKGMRVLLVVCINKVKNGDLRLELTCIAKMLLGRISLCCLMLKCHVLILIMSSNMNSRYRRPSTHTCSWHKYYNPTVNSWWRHHAMQREQHLREHGFAILGHHGALVAVEWHKVTVERLLWVLQNIEQLSGASLENTPKVSWNQRPANGCRCTRLYHVTT